MRSVPVRSGIAVTAITLLVVLVGGPGVAVALNPGPPQSPEPPPVEYTTTSPYPVSVSMTWEWDGGAPTVRVIDGAEYYTLDFRFDDTDAIYPDNTTHVTNIIGSWMRIDGSWPSSIAFMEAWDSAHQCALTTTRAQYNATGDGRAVREEFESIVTDCLERNGLPSEFDQTREQLNHYDYGLRDETPRHPSPGRTSINIPVDDVPTWIAVAGWEWTNLVDFACQRGNITNTNRDAINAMGGVAFPAGTARTFCFPPVESVLMITVPITDPTPAPTAAPDPLPHRDPVAAASAPRTMINTTFSAPSTYSGLPTVAESSWGGVLAAGTTGLVLAILVAFPTRLLESTLEANADRVAGWARKLMPAPWRRHRAANGGHSTSWTVSGWWGVPIIATGIILTAFADQRFGFNWISLRLILTALVVFIVIDLFRMLASRAAVRRTSGPPAEPRWIARPVLLAILVVTASFAHVTGIDPAIVLGTLIAVDFGVELATRRDAQVTLAGFLYTTTAGLTAWALYSLLTWVTPWFTAVTEVFAVLTIAALAAAPIALLPLSFLEGATIWSWNKWVWGACFLVANTVFAFVLVPMGFAWQEPRYGIFVWVGVFAVYALISVVVWRRLARQPKNRRDSSDETPSGFPPVEEQLVTS